MGTVDVLQGIAGDFVKNCMDFLLGIGSELLFRDNKASLDLPVGAFGKHGISISEKERGTV